LQGRYYRFQISRQALAGKAEFSSVEVGPNLVSESAQMSMATLEDVFCEGMAQKR
jgi:hypothetical protein